MSKFALLVIDVQQAFAQRDARGDNRSCPQADENISTLLELFRNSDLPIIHIHHHSAEENSDFRADRVGSQVQDFAKPKAGELLLIKQVNSGFIGTTLERDLETMGRPTLVICGATANHCVETTTRMAGNLGFDALYVSDAVWAYDQTAMNGQVIAASQVHDMSLANLNGEFATVLPTREVMGIVSNKSTA